MLLDRRFSRRRFRRQVEDVDPMSYTGNLSDAMLVVAVGIMIALISAWQLDVSDMMSRVRQVEPAEPTEISAEEGALDQMGLMEAGTVYVDENGEYYMVESAE